MTRLRSWFLPETPDVLGILRRQGMVTVAGMEAFASWSRTGSAKEAQSVREREHAADDVRRELLEALSRALTTPVDQEDVYTLSERLDAVMNAAKNAVRDSEAFGVRPDAHMAAMGALALEGTGHIAGALARLGSRREVPGEHADAAIKTARKIERAFREAMTSVPASADARSALALRELYHDYTVIAEAIVHVATRTHYALLKTA